MIMLNVIVCYSENFVILTIFPYSEIESLTTIYQSNFYFFLSYLLKSVNYKQVIKQYKGTRMCNSYYHSQDCNCGWGGMSYGVTGIKGALNQNSGKRTKQASPAIEGYTSPEIIETAGAKTYPTKCKRCQAEVFYHTNGYGDHVLFDDLGSPWQVHYCWRIYWKFENDRREEMSRYYYRHYMGKIFTINDEQFRRIILAGAIQKINYWNVPVTEEKVSKRLGIDLNCLRKCYGRFYEGYRQDGISQIRLS